MTKHTRKQLFDQRGQAGNPGLPAPKSLVTTAKAVPTETETTKHTLSPMQTMAVRLMVAREAVKQKSAFISKLQANNGKRAQQDAQRIGALEVEVADLTQQLMQTLINMESADNDRLAQEYGLPSGSVNYKQDGQGNFYYETAAPAALMAEPADMNDEIVVEDSEAADVPPVESPEEFVARSRGPVAATKA